MKLEKPYLEKDRLDFIVKYNHNLGKKIEEDEDFMYALEPNEYLVDGMIMVDDVRYENTRSLSNYLKGNHVLKQEILSKQDMMYNEIMLGLRKVEGVNLQEFYNKYEENLQEVFNIKDLLKEHELIYSDGYLYVNPDYMYVMNEILIKIL